MPCSGKFRTQIPGNGPSALHKLRKQDDPQLWTSLRYITVRLQAGDILLDPR